jgi:hypothetical protein
MEEEKRWEKFRKESEKGQQVTKTGRVGDGKGEQKMGNEVRG